MPGRVRSRETIEPPTRYWQSSLICHNSAMDDANPIERLRRKFEALAAVLDERSRRQWAASEAQELGYGGISSVARATGLARDTIRLGMGELKEEKKRGRSSF